MSSVKRIIGAAMVGVALGCPVLYARPGLAQAPSNPQVEIVYARPRAANLQAVANRLKSRRVLEEFAQFMLPLKLPTTLTVQFDQCGGNARLYKPGEPATICYELVDQIEKIAAKSVDDREMILAGAVTQAVFHAAANAVFDILDVPIWGRREDAADRLAGFLMVELGADLAYWTIVGTASFFQDSGKTWTGSQFAEASSPEAQRYFNYLCMAYGGDPVKFGYLVAQPDDKSKEPFLPKDRAEQCRDEFTQVRSAFNLRIMPYVDPDLLVQVRATKWAVSSRRK
jgi:Putative metallopeptidase